MRWSSIAIVALLGCSEPKLVESLIAADRWTAVAAENDPYAAHRPAPGECPAASYGLEDLGGEMTLFVNTLDCAYLTVEQASLVEVEKEDPIRVRVWHFGLDKLDGVATATLALTVGEHTVLDEKIALPSESDLIALEWLADFDAPAGSRAVFHLRNHGSNSYNLIELSRGGELPQE